MLRSPDFQSGLQKLIKRFCSDVGDLALNQSICPACALAIASTVLAVIADGAPHVSSEDLDETLDESVFAHKPGNA